MFINQTESTQFIQSLKAAGVTIHNERDVIERLQEAREWHFAFSTLVRQGNRIGIGFAASRKPRSDRLKRIFEKFRFNARDEVAFEAALVS